MTVLAHIADTADQLTEPTLHREPYHTWDHNRHRKLHHHTTVQPGLLAQLHQSVNPVWSIAGEWAGGIPTSRPPLEMEALSRHAQIASHVRDWCLDLRIDLRATPESNIRALVGAATLLDTDRQHQLLADLRRWRGWCRVYLQLERVETIRDAPCPITECAQRGTLRINLTTATGMCTACGATWTHDTIGVLGEHIRASRDGSMSR